MDVEHQRDLEDNEQEYIRFSGLLQTKIKTKNDKSKKSATNKWFMMIHEPKNPSVYL